MRSTRFAAVVGLVTVGLSIGIQAAFSTVYTTDPNRPVTVSGINSNNGAASWTIEGHVRADAEEIARGS